MKWKRKWAHSTQFSNKRKEAARGKEARDTYHKPPYAITTSDGLLVFEIGAVRERVVAECVSVMYRTPSAGYRGRAASESPSGCALRV